MMSKLWECDCGRMMLDEEQKCDACGFPRPQLGPIPVQYVTADEVRQIVREELERFWPIEPSPKDKP